MPRRVTSIAAATAHLIGPGKLQVINSHLAYRPDKDTPLRLEPSELRAILCYGPISITADALDLLFRQPIQIAWLTLAGHRCLGRLASPASSMASLRSRQHQAFAMPEFARQWAASIVIGKIQSQVVVARHYQRHGVEEAGAVLSDLAQAVDAANNAETIDILRGIEGASTAAWFRLLSQVFQPPWKFGQRVRRPPTDPVNALLSLGYTWLLTRTVARTEAAGLEVYLGGLHAFRAGRPSLACDLMEPFRATAVDRWVIRMCNESKVQPDDFVAYPEKGLRLKPERFGDIVYHYEGHWVQSKMPERLDQMIEGTIERIRRAVPENLIPDEDADL